ncbi:MAG TPA: ATP-binding cassette domain-containing protein [Candidatus Dormibacteraeota bacterium]|nr:ATP-binding cassette domain-containing protein [Candidatus Dormibacteraeota bacterium]
MAIGSLANLTYWYPGSREPALSDVSTLLDDGLTVIAGPSGGGKSTLLRVLNGLVPHFHGGRIAGGARVLGLDVIRTPTRDLARSVGFVFQDPELQTVYSTVDREVAFGLENIGVPTRMIAGRVEEALQAAGIGHLVGRTVRTLSGGERQRVALASSIAMRPQLVVLDEPTSQLDPDGAGLVLATATRLVDEGLAVIISEHRLDRLLKAAAGLVLVGGGRVERADPAIWRPPSAAGPSRRMSAPGSETWSLEGATAGFNGQPVVEDVNLNGRAGEVVVLNGPNGGGKTTLLRLIAGGLAPLAGRVQRRPGRIAYLPQNPIAVLHRPTLRAEVRLTLDRSGDHELPEEILNALGLLHVADRYPRDLSTGERQRAALAAVLPGTPTMALLDEPTRGMDVAARDALVSLVTRLRERGAAIVLATHDSDLTLALADRIAYVANGRVFERVVETVQP